jgi:hypothetical protein
MESRGQVMQKGFSAIEHNFKDFKLRLEHQAAFKPVEAWPEKERTDEARVKRVQKACEEYSFFDKTYFPADMYDDGYFSPNPMLAYICNIYSPGVHIVLGPRSHGKTVTAKKRHLWRMLTGRDTITGVYCETLTKSSSMLEDLYDLCDQNAKIMYDFKIYFETANSDELQMRVPPLPVALKGHYSFCAAFSEGRSVRGFTKKFGRPSYITGDDLETLESSFSQDAVKRRIDKISETIQSMSKNGLFLIMGNDFNSNSALHTLRQQAEENLLDPDYYKVAVFQAWASKKSKWQPAGVLWKEKYPVTNEVQLRKLIKPRDESDYQANFQMNPIPPDGFFFKREFYKEFLALPRDARGVSFTDPNLSKKGKGDATAITVLLYSPSTNEYYVAGADCRSFSDSNALLDGVLALKTDRVRYIGFDGNVSQESTWSNNVRNYCKIKQRPYPPIHYKHYRVNEIAKNCQMAYTECRILFPVGFSKTKHGEKYLTQLFAFTGKTASSRDDAPDSLISAFELLNEHPVGTSSSLKVTIVKDVYDNV